MLAVSGPVATAIGDIIGAGDVALTVWDIARWPLILARATSLSTVLRTPK
jgi:membrane protein